MSANKDGTTDEAAIRGLVENPARAVRRQNLDGILANHSPDMLDVPPPAQSKKNRSVQENVGAVFFLVS